jgi:hypothetical protein
MSKPNFLELYTKYVEAEKLTEATTTSTYRGTYKPPIRPGLTYWDPEDLQPYVDPVSKYVNAEINYDSLDGDISTPKKEIAKKEKISKKIQKKDFIQDSADEGDDEYSHAPFKILKPYYEVPDLVESEIKEDLAVWFGTKKKPKGSKQPKGPWVNICRKKEGGGHPPCGRPEADSKGYPKCRAAGVASKMTDAQKRAACQQKRRAEKKNQKVGTGNSPTMVSYKPKKKSQNESALKNLILKVLTGK